MADPSTAPAMEDANLAKIQTLLKAKDDTQRFVGLALLKSLLDNSSQIRQDEAALRELWAAISSKFLDRLLRTGSKPSGENAKEMLDLAVSILHTFSILLPAESLAKSKFTERVRGLVAAVLYSSQETTELLLQLLYTLASSQNGAEALLNIEDLSPLTEIATAHPIVLDIFLHAWLSYMTATDNIPELSVRIDATMQSLVSSFRGTDAVTLLEFLGAFLRQADSSVITTNPKWLKPVIGYIQNLVTSRPTPEARSAYTNSAASLLQTFPNSAPSLLFTDTKKEDKPFAYLLINLLLIDIRSSIPSLLSKLNDPDYTKTSRRLASAFDCIGIFIGHLVRCLEDDTMETFIMEPDTLLKIRKPISETMSVTIEYLRDRWDASVAGAMGLHPDARSSTTATSTGSHFTLTWDSMKNIAEEDPFILSALQALALWLREDENEQLRKEATGLTDVFLDLYRASSSDKLDFRSAAVVAFEGLASLERGRDAILRHDGWELLSKDLVSSLQAHREIQADREAAHIIDIVRVLLAIAESERSGTLENWMDIVTGVAAWDVPETASPVAQEAQVAVLQLCCTLLAGTNTGMRSRYTHSIHAIAGIASQLNRSVSNEYREQMDDVLQTLKTVSP